MRKEFMKELVNQAEKNDKIWLLTGDLGYGLLDEFRDRFTDRFVQCGAAEQAMMDIACGLAIKGKIPFVYSITTFLLYRPFESLRTYINKEKIKVLLVGSGRDYDYKHDGWSHHSPDAKGFLDLLPNIKQYWPLTAEEIPVMLEEMINQPNPSFISLRR